MPNPARRQRAAALTLLMSAAALSAPTASASIAGAKRGYELVSPAGVGLVPINNFPTVGPWTSPVSPSGRVLMASNPSFPNDEQSAYGSVVVAERSSTGWAHTVINPVPHAQFRHDGISVLSASADLRTVVTQAIGAAPMVGEPLTPTAYDPAGAYQYVFSTTGGVNAWLTRPQTVRDRIGDVLVSNPGIYATSDDGTTTVFAERASLTDDVPVGLDRDQLYQRRGDQISAIARRIDGSLALDGIRPFGLSSDGRRTLFADYALQSDSSTLTDLLVARDGAATVHANRPRRAGSPARTNDGGLVWARLTPDGETVVFATNEALLDADTDTARDIYRYRVSDDSLTLVSRGGNGATGGNATDCSAVANLPTCDVEAAMVSRDGRSVYFLSAEQLDGTRGDATTPSLYVSVDGAAPHFVASIPTPDSWMTSLVAARPEYQVTDQGDLVFESANALTGTTGGVGQVFRYDASDDATTCLTCLTDRPGGGAPSGSSTLSVKIAEGQARGTAAFDFFPGDGGAPRVTADGSTVFVTSYDRLVAADQNEASDVYAIDVVSGAKHLITTGRSDTDSYLYGITPDGENAFFVTADSLDPRDDNGPSVKVYDARIGGGFPAASGGTPCRGAACRVLLDPPAAPGNFTQTTTADDTTAPDDLDAELVTPSSKDRARIATTGKLKVKVNGLRPGAVAALRVRVRLSSRSSVSADVTSRGGAADRTLTVRFSRSQRLRIRSARRARSLPVELRLDHGADAPTTLTTSIARVRKGR